MSPLYEQETVLAMELNRSHIGCLVQIITEEWSMTGTLKTVDQHDNREWDIDYANGRRLIPRAGEIYAFLTIGPWEGRVIGNQPVTVERVAGTLEAPERAALKDPRRIAADLTPLERIQPGQVADLFDVPVEMLDPDVIKGDVVRSWCGKHRCCREADHDGPCEEDATELPPAPEEWPDLPKD